MAFPGLWPALQAPRVFVLCSLQPRGHLEVLRLFLESGSNTRVSLSFLYFRFTFIKI